MRFSDGAELREHWDGKAAWRGYRVVRDAPLTAVQIDRSRKLMVDVQPQNNGRTTTADARFTADWGGWLGALASPVIVMIDACQSGGFLSMAGGGRTIITSAAQSEVAYFTGQGLLSWSSYFWNAALNGDSIGEVGEVREELQRLRPGEQRERRLDQFQPGDRHQVASRSCAELKLHPGK